jgi:hypothetical protein
VRVAVFGNNLNQGFFLARFLRESGVEADLFFRDYSNAQERPEWWLAAGADDRLIRRFRLDWSMAAGWLRPCEHAEVQQAYAAARSYDILQLSEEGPALFDGLKGGPAKVFRPLGADLRVLPFLAGMRLGELPRDALGALRAGRPGLAYAAALRLMEGLRLQRRQRAGLRSCEAVLSGTGADERLHGRLGLDPGRVRYLPMPMDPAAYSDADGSLAAGLRRRYADVDLLLLHPARQFHLALDGNRFLKDNDKLLRAYAAFARGASRRTRLLLVAKGREEDLAESRRLVSELGLGERTEWLPEMPNRELRAYYGLEQVVVCDQFNPNLAFLGNVGREAALFGRPLVTAFRESWARPVFGDDLPPHVLAAESEAEILAVLRRLDSPEGESLRRRAARARSWFDRHLHKDRVMPRYVELFKGLLSARGGA